MKVMIFSLTNLYREQELLDETILKKHHLTHQATRISRLLALLVELGEFANENRSFKYWSQNKNINQQQMIEEYIDCLHFFLSLGVYFKNKKTEYRVYPTKNFIQRLLQTFYEVSLLKKNFRVRQYEKAFASFLSLYDSLGIPVGDLSSAYLKKRKTNIERQKNNY